MSFASAGVVTSTTLVDPWGGDVTGAWVLNPAQQKRKFTTYERGADNRDEAQQRGYSAWFSRFDQPDPWDGSYDLTDPQSLNRYSYVQGDPVNFVDPSGLNMSATCFGLTYTLTTFADGVKTGSKSWTVWSHCVTSGGDGGRRGGGGLGAGNRGPLGPAQQERTPDACGTMAAFAQMHAESAIKDAKGDMNAAVKLFDERFSKDYLGYPLRTPGDGWKLGRKGGLNSSTIESYHRGATGFRDNMKDGHFGVTTGKDQTHHFAAYLSAAINDVYLSSSGHQWLDVFQGNFGDSRLGQAAYDIGRDLRNDPGKLKGIRDIILKSVCAPRP